MAEIKWIKITTNIFDDEKIKIIDTYPARDEILVIWFKLLALAGKTNQNGMLFMNNRIPYTVEMLAAVFNRELNSVRLALNTFEGFGMVEIEDNEVITISNWDKHQNIEGMDKIREQNRLRQQKHREKKKNLLECNVISRDSNAIEVDKELDKEREGEKELEIDNTIVETKVSQIPYQQIVASYNSILGGTLSKVVSITNTRKQKIKVRWNNDIKTINDWEFLFNKVANTPFLLGDNNNGWKCGFDWLVKNDSNFLKVLEGNYDKQDGIQAQVNVMKDW